LKAQHSAVLADNAASKTRLNLERFISTYNV